MKILAIDQGTSSTRGFLLDANGLDGNGFGENGSGRIICHREHQQFYPAPGRVEHDPEELLHHLLECIDSAGEVGVIGLDNQGESCLAWDSRTGEAISPVIVWQDRRTETRIEALRETGAESLTLKYAGLPLDPYFSASKLAWILTHIPKAKSLLAQGRLHLGTTDAFFIERLTGTFATDITTASRTSLLNLNTGKWDEALCDLFSIPMQCLPEIRPTMGDFGRIKHRGRSIPLNTSVVDQQASLYGHGCRQAGDVKITFGTGAFTLALTGSALHSKSDTGLLPTIAWQASNQSPVYALDGAVYCASSALNWARSLGLFKQFEEINQFSFPPAIEQGLVFVPALTGLACPYWDGSAAGMWLGMSLDTHPEQLIQAILEGVALRTGEVIDAMQKQITIGAEISIDGGMSANPYFCQFLADTLQKRIRVQSVTELTAMGTAMMSATGMGLEVPLIKDGHCYQPETTRAPDKQRFADAVKRSRGWR